jgi:imidazolonepropionase-like amidohydrolase
LDYYYNCRLIDGTGAGAVEDAVLITDGSKIVYAGAKAGAPSPQGAVSIDLGGRTILPGLFNCHVHLALRFPFTPYYVDEYKTPGYRAMVMYRRAIESLFCGVTTIRCTGESDYSDVAVRDAINRNMVMGPRILTAGPIIIAHGGHGAGQWGSIECSGPYEFMRETRNVIVHGVDLIKICTTGGMVGEYEGANTMQMTEEEITAVTQVAAKYNKTVAGHIGNDEAIRAAIRCGVTSIEHGYLMNRETAEIMADSDAFLVPTLAVSAACDYLEKHNNPRYHIEKIRKIGKKHMQSAANAIAAGVRIAVGTDLLPSDPLDGTNATIREVELLTEAGMSPLAALHAATGNSAALCGVAEVTGTLEAGKEADLIAVSGMPDKNIRDLRNLDMVVRGGSLVRSSISGDTRPRFSPLPFGEVPSGASFINW